MAKPSNDCRVKGLASVLSVNIFHLPATDWVAGAESSIYFWTWSRVCCSSHQKNDKHQGRSVHYILFSSHWFRSFLKFMRKQIWTPCPSNHEKRGTINPRLGDSYLYNDFQWKLAVATTPWFMHACVRGNQGTMSCHSGYKEATQTWSNIYIFFCLPPPQQWKKNFHGRQYSGQRYLHIFILHMR